MPGSIHEGGELGYSLAHAFGAAFDNPGLIVACVVGDGEAETGPLATSWHANKFLDPRRDGAVLPILHLNGYKIANPTVLSRIAPSELDSLLRGYGYEPIYVEGDDPETMHQAMAAALDSAVADLAVIRRSTESAGVADDRAAQPQRLDRTVRCGRCPGRGHLASAPGAARRGAAEPRAPAELEEWLRSYRPEELFDERGRPSRGRDRDDPARATGGWARARTPTAAPSCVR